MESVELLRAIVEEKLYRVYETSPWLSKDEILKKYLKKIGGRFKKRADLLQELINLTDGQRTVLDVSKELRIKGFRVSPEDVFEIYERYRNKGIVRVKTVGRPEIAAPAEAYMKTAIIPAESIVEKLRSVPEVERVETLKDELDKLLTKLEEIPTVPEEPSEIVPSQLVPIRKVAEDVIRIKMSGLIENLFAIDNWIDVIMLATREGDPIVFFSRTPDVDINQANLAAASAVIYSVSKTGSESFERGRVKEILILAKNGFILLRPLADVYIMISLIDRRAKLGIALRDLNWVSKEMEALISGELQERLIK